MRVRVYVAEPDFNLIVLNKRPYNGLYIAYANAMFIDNCIDRKPIEVARFKILVECVSYDG